MSTPRSPRPPTSSATLTTNYDANPGPSSTSVLTWVVPDFSLTFADTLTLEFVRPFFYDPRAGNLLLDIRKDTSFENGDGPIYIDGAQGGQIGISLTGNILSFRLEPRQRSITLHVFAMRPQ